MKIAFVSHRIHQGAGPARYAAELVKSLDADHEVSVFSFDFAKALAPKARFHRVPTWQRSWIGRYLSFIVSHTILMLLLRLFRSGHFDIIHASGVDSPLLANVVTVHFCEREGLELEERGLGRASAGSLGQWMRALDYHWYRHLAAWVEGIIIKHRPNCRIIAISERGRRELIRHYGREAERAIVIPHGVDVDLFHPQNRHRYRAGLRDELGLSPDDMVLLFLGGDWERKGLPQALDALTKIEDKEVKLLVVGPGDQAHYDRLAHEKGLGGRVIFVGQRRDVERFYAAADVFLLPTVYEPFGLVITEAMAAALPVITSRLAGASSFIKDGHSGLLLSDPTDSNLLAQKITWLLEDEGRRQQMGRQARRAVEGHTWSAMVQRTLEAYDQILASDELGTKPGEEALDTKRSH